MKKIVYLLTKKEDLENQYIDALLIPLKDYSCRSQYELTFDEIKKLKTDKEIFLLCDKLISEIELEQLTKDFIEINKIAKKIFFQDLSFVMLAKEHNCLDKLVYYSPTLCVNYQDIEVYQQMGINNFILSKENTYVDYIEILKHSKANLGMLALGRPQLYFSKRKMISCFKEEFSLDIPSDNLFIKEKTRNFYQPIFEDKNGTFIFAGDIFFPYKSLHEFYEKGMLLFLIDPSFINIETNLAELVDLAINNKLEQCEFASNYLMYHQMVNDYGK